MSHVCPLAPSSPVFNVGRTSTWRGDRSCSYCGSLHPDDFMAAIDAGATLVPTDKCYKVYLRTDGAAQRKFYFEHLDETQRERFFDRLNLGQLTLATPGYFYVLPFFIGRAANG